MARNPRVFLSYAHGDDAHMQRVFDLSERLLSWGVDSNIDQYEVDPRGGWPLWSQKQIEDADFVLVIATRAYLRRFEMKEDRGTGAGSKWEGAIIIQALYEAEGTGSKFIPVAFEDSDIPFIPTPIRGQNRYVLSEPNGFERLYRRLTGQPEVSKGAIGKLRILPQLRVRSGTPSAPRSDEAATEAPQLSRETMDKKMLDHPATPSERKGGRRAARSEEGRLRHPAEASPGDLSSLDALTLRDNMTITIPLLEALHRSRTYETDRITLFDVVIEPHLDYPRGLVAARARIAELVHASVSESEGGAQAEGPTAQGIDAAKTNLSAQYIFARLSADVMQDIVKRDRIVAKGVEGFHRESRAVYRIWPDFQVRPLLTDSVRTIEAEYTHRTFGADGAGIVWAVVDTGIDGTHPHFQRHMNLALDQGIQHIDFTKRDSRGGEAPLNDEVGHGTHVAGIIAGECDPPATAMLRERDEAGNVVEYSVHLPGIRGIAPRCKLVSLKVLDEYGSGLSSSVIAALEYVHRINGYGRRLVIHGVNISLGYSFDGTWLMTGLSPLCMEVDRLVRSGVIVVVAAGNSGHISVSASNYAFSAPLSVTIDDPGNAALAITVGSTHRTHPNLYGVSIFSSKGPTADGRPKPDVVAPGERIISCATGRQLTGLQLRASRRSTPAAQYLEDSGTSVAAAHVSGAIAAFLSVRRSFIGRPEAVKTIFMKSATDLGRAGAYQGAGLLNARKAIESG